LVDNAYCDFHFSPPVAANPQPVRLVLMFHGDSKDSMLAAYAPPDPTVIGFGFRVPSAERTFPLVYRDEETGTTIWENPEAIPRVFLAPEVFAASSREEALSQLGNLPDLERSVVVDNGKIARQDPGSSQRAGSLRAFRLSPNDVSINYIANIPGVLTLADSYSEGWHAEVNGLQTPVLRVDGAFRAFQLKTPDELPLHLLS